MDRLLTIAELSEQLGIKKSTLYRWAYDGVLPAVRLGSMWRFPKSEIEEWVESHRVKKSQVRSLEKLSFSAE